MTTHSKNESEIILDRAQKALVALRYKEQAAIYHAAAASLEAAINGAVGGEIDQIDKWFQHHQTILDGSLESNHEFPLGQSLPLGRAANSTSQSISLPSKLGDSTVAEMVSQESELLVTEQVCSLSSPTDNVQDQATGPWDRMLGASTQRVASFKGKIPILEGDGSSEESLAAWVAEPMTPTLGIETNPTANAVNETKSLVQESEKIVLDPLTFATTGEKPKRPFYASIDLWGSLIVHVLLVAVLGVIVVTQATKAEKVAIVSAPYEGEVALTETPIESETETLEEEQTTTPVEPTSLADATDISTPSFDANVSAPTVAVNTGSGSIASQMKSAIQGATQAKASQSASFFGLQATGNVFIYLVDSSPSMRKDGAFDAARNEMIRSLSSMKPKQRFYLLFFGKEADQMVLHGNEPEPQPVYATPENVKLAVEWLKRASVQKDGWPPNDALKIAIDMAPDAIFLLFDGNTRADVPKYLRQINRTQDIISEDEPKVPIHVIHFFDEEYSGPMQKVAKENMGTYRFVPRPQKDTTKRQ